MRLLIFFALLAGVGADASPSDLRDPVDLRDPAAWLRALHVGTGVWGDGFFLSVERTPEREREEMRRRFQETQGDDPDAHVGCRFPWRARVLGLENPSLRCPRLQKWREAFRAEAVELLFASAFLNSPSSMYGHTLLKFRRGGNSQDLLHYTLSFGADTGDSGGLAYVWKGLTGAFPGYFSSAPFYLKVKEYNHVENRDFWIYSLNFTPEETRALVDHAWELREARFDYYFLSRNCSWYLLDFLEAAKPELPLTRRFPAWAIPSDTVRVLDEAGMIASRERRPSRAFWVERRRGELLPEERALAEDWALGGAPDMRLLSPERQALVLDAAWDWFRFREGRGLVMPGGDGAILQARARLRVPSRQYSKEATPPEEGHGTERLGFRGGTDREKSFVQIEYRGALHDLTDDPAGYEPHSELVMGDLRARWSRRRLELDRADVLRILSIAPQDPWMPRVAWNFTLGARTARWMECGRCLEYRTDAGVGQSLSVIPGGLHAFAFLNTALRAGPAFHGRSFQADLGPRGGVLWQVLPSVRLLVDATHRWAWWGHRRADRSLHASLTWNGSRRSAWKLDALRSRGHGELSAGWFRHF